MYVYIACLHCMFTFYVYIVCLHVKFRCTIKSVCTLNSIGPPKQDRKQSIKNKNNRSLSFHFDLFSGCWFVDLLVCRFVRFS